LDELAVYPVTSSAMSPPITTSTSPSFSNSSYGSPFSSGNSSNSPNSSPGFGLFYNNNNNNTYNPNRLSPTNMNPFPLLNNNNNNIPITNNSLPHVIFNSKINNLTELMTNRASMQNLMRSYFEVFSMGAPLIDCKQSLELVTQMTSFQNFSLDNLGNSSITLLFLSIQTFCLQRLGHKEIGHQLYQYCLQLLAQQMLNTPDEKDRDRDGNMACALITLAFYLVGQGGASKQQAKLYLHNCKFYLASMLQDKTRTDECPFKSRLCAIQKYINLIELVLTQDNLTASLEVIQRLVTQFDRVCNPLKNAPPMFQLPINPAVNEAETIEYLKKTSTVIDEIYSQKKTCSQKMNDVIRLTFKLMFDGLRLQILMMEPEKNYSEMVQLADQITENANLNCDAFASCPTLVVHAVSLAAKVHLKQQNETFLSTPETLEKIERDLNALKVLDKQFGIVSEEHGDEMREMEKWVVKKQEQQKMETTGNIFEDFLSSIDMNDILESGFLNSPTIHLTPDANQFNFDMPDALPDHFKTQSMPQQQQQQQHYHHHSVDNNYYDFTTNSAAAINAGSYVPPESTNQFINMLIDDVELNDVNYLAELI
jgi:hypothetical protein